MLQEFLEGCREFWGLFKKLSASGNVLGDFCEGLKGMMEFSHHMRIRGWASSEVS
jgi:hypothetical protein